jgi:hypothetical protein
MVALPSAVKVNEKALSRAAAVDDIARLKEEMKLAEFTYIDVTAQRELKNALRRWPLLAEIEQAMPLLEPQVIA